jgi:subtilase family serine protease
MGRGARKAVGLWLWLAAGAAGAAPIDAGLAYVQAHRDPVSGAYGTGRGEEGAITTPEVLAALQAVGEDGSAEALGAELYLALVPDTAESELVLRRQLALRTLGPLFAPRTTHAEGFDAPDALHQALSLRALRALPLAPATTRLARALAGVAREDGCFAYADNGPSVSLTAEALLALFPYAYDASVAPGVQAGLACLKGLQRADGSFGALDATAMAAVALVEAPGSHAAALAAARAHLEGAQGADGSWGRGSVRLTALAVRALAAARPDWRVVQDPFGRALVTLAPASQLQGQPFTATVEVENRSAFAAPAVPVRFLAVPAAGGEPVVLGAAEVPALAGGARATVGAALPTAALAAGLHLVQAEVNPGGAVPEHDPLDNTAVGRLTVSSGHDLAVTTASLSFAPVSDGQVRVDVAVRNLGAALPREVPVEVWRGAVGNGGVRLGTALLPQGLPSNAAHTASVPWATAGVNGPTPVHAVVDPAGVLAEREEGNNAAFRFFEPGASARPVDLAVSGEDVTHSPVEPVALAPVTVAVRVRNLSAHDAGRVTVALWDLGNEDGAPLAAAELPGVPAGGSAVAELQVTLDSNATLRAVVDPGGRLADPQRGNNRALHAVTLVQRPAVELTLEGLSANGSGAGPGGTFTLSASLTNNGRERVSSVVELVDQADGSVWARVPVAALASGSTQSVDFGTRVRPAHVPVLRACVDPDGALAEVNENDNCAEASISPATMRLSVHPEDLTVTPAGADVGERVQLAAVVRNPLAVEGRATLEWWQGRPSYAEGRKLGETRVAVAPGGSARVTFDWLRQEGPVEVFARLVRFEGRLDTSTSIRGGQVAGRHLFLRELVKLDVGVTQPQLRTVQAEEVRVGRLVAGAPPDVVVAYRASTDAGRRGGVQVLGLGADGRRSKRWEHATLESVNDVVLVDLEGDGEGEVVVSSETVPGSGPGPQRLTVLDADGVPKWSVDGTSVGSCFKRRQTLGLADFDRDGVTDVVAYDRLHLRVYAGATGGLLLSATPFGAGASCDSGGATRVDALDVDGDGDLEFLLGGGRTALVDHTGALVWSSGASTGSGEYPIVDLDLDGSPEFVVLRHLDGAQVFDARTGQLKWTAPPAAAHAAGVVAGPFRQDGLAYLAHGSNSFRPNFTAFTPDLQMLWSTSTVPFEATDTYIGTAADLLGLGRPQLLPQSKVRGLFLLDSRDGRPLTPPPSTMKSVNGTIDGDLTYSDRGPPLVADVEGDGHAEVLVGRNTDCNHADGSAWAHDNQWPQYGCNQVLVYASPHWKRQPTAWPTRTLRRGQLGEDLRLGGDFAWWRSVNGNTYNQQFLDAPARLLPDLTLASVALTATPQVGAAGQTVQLAAQVRNAGGLPADGVRVAFFDGDPAAGGVRLGTATVAGGPLAPRTGTGTATLAWRAWPEGEHRIHVVVNPEGEGALEESGRENNGASEVVRVGPPSGPACNLALDGASVSATPALPAAGAPVTLAATARNRGTASCAATALAVRGPSGEELTAAPLPALAAGEEAAVAALLPAAPPGATALTLVADPAGLASDADPTDNSAFFALTAQEPTLPDLRVAQLGLAPAGPAREGERVTLTARVDNAGAPAPEVAWSARLGGVVVGGGVLPALATGEQTALTLQLTAPAASAPLEVQVDVEGRVAELSEGNNTGRTTLAVEGAGLSLALTAAPGSAGPDTPVALQLQLSNGRASHRELSLTVRALTAGGEAVGAVLAPTRLLLGPSQAALVPAAWNTARLPAGAYRLVAEALEGGRPAARGERAFTVTGAPAAATVLVADQGSYAPGDDALLTQRTSNASLNTWLRGATVRVAVADASGAPLLATTRPVPALPPGAHFDTSDLLALSPRLPPGRYGATSEVRAADGRLLASAEASFALVFTPAEAVRGTLQVRSPFPLGPALTATVTLANAGGRALEGAPLVVRVLDAVSLEEQARGTTTASLAAGAEAAFRVALPTGAIPPGQKLVVAELEGRTLERVLAAAQPRVDLDPPVITLAGVADGDLVRGPVSPAVTVTDASDVTATLLLDGEPFANGAPVSAEGLHVLQVRAVDAEGNRAELTASFTLDATRPLLVLSGVAPGAVVGAPVTLTFTASDAHLGEVTSVLDGSRPLPSGSLVADEGDHLWVVTARDRAGNEAVASRAFTLDLTAPRLLVTGVANGGLYRAPVTPVVAVEEAHPDRLTVTLDGAPFTSGTPVSAEGPHTLVVEARDAAGNTARLTLTFTLDLTAPTLEVAGVAEGQVAEAFTITFTASDVRLASVTATLDGAPFASGGTVTAPGAHALVVRAEDAAGNTAERAVAFTVAPATDWRVPAFAFAACATEELLVRGNAEVRAAADGGRAHVASHGRAELVGAARVAGGLVTGGEARVGGTAQVEGRAFHGGELRLFGKGRVLGGAERVTPAPAPCTCGFPLAEALAAVRAQNDNARLAALPDSGGWLVDGALVLPAGRTLTLPAGRYHLTRVQVSPGATLAVAEGARVELFVDGDFRVPPDAALAADPARGAALLVVSGADAEAGGEVTLPDAPAAPGGLAAQVYAPGAHLDLAGNGRLTGALVGRRVQLRGGRTLQLPDGTPDNAEPRRGCE